MDPDLSASAFSRVTEIYCSSFRGTDEFVAYHLATGAVRGSPTEGIVLAKRQEIDNGPMMPVIAPDVDVDWFPGAASTTISEVERDYR